MPIYRYKAVDTSGELAIGELEAGSEVEIVERLRDQGLLPMQDDAAGAIGASAARPRVAKARRR